MPTYMSRSTDMDLAWILKMPALPSRSGNENSILLSIRPGLSLKEIVSILAKGSDIKVTANSQSGIQR